MTTQPTLLMVHGWGLGPGVWRPLLKALDRPAIRPDLGFYGPPQLEIPDDRPLIGIGQSLGFLWLLHHRRVAPWGERLQGLIALNGFSCFAQRENFPHGVSLCQLRQMKNGLQRQPIQVLEDFRRLGRGPETFLPEVARERLRAMALAYGLAWLVEWDERESLAQWDKPLLAIAHEDDRVVTPAMSRDGFADLRAERQQTLRWLPKGGHLGLLTDAAPFADLIRPFLNEMGDEEGR